MNNIDIRLYKFAQLTDIKLIRKTADETVNNSNVYQDDDELVLPVAANSIWKVELFILKLSGGGAAQDTTFKFTAPVGGEFYWGNDSFIGPLSLSTAFIINPITGNVRMQAEATTLIAAQFFGVYIGGANAGSLQLQWAQNVPEAINHTIKANSFLIGTKLS